MNSYLSHIGSPHEQRSCAQVMLGSLVWDQRFVKTHGEQRFVKPKQLHLKKKKKKIKKEYVDLTNLQEEKMNVNAGKSPWT